MTGDAPPLVATVGLHGSASTWVFNVVRELVAAVGPVVGCYADELAKVPERAGACLVVKSHHGSVALDDWLKANRAPMFLSVRDPRDACMSMAQRFKAPLNQTAGWLANDCDRLSRLAGEGHPLLRYEDRFFDDPRSVALLAAALGVQVGADVVAAIFERYRTEAVRAFAAELTSLPADRLQMVGPFPMDRETQILGPHIGDTTSGKWHHLPEPIRAELTRAFGPFLDRFGYPR